MGQIKSDLGEAQSAASRIAGQIPSAPSIKKDTSSSYGGNNSAHEAITAYENAIKNLSAGLQNAGQAIVKVANAFEQTDQETAR